MTDQTEQVISATDFHRWKHDPVTIYISKIIVAMREQIEASLISSDLVMAPNSDKALARLVGQRDIIDALLTISIDDIEDIQDET